MKVLPIVVFGARFLQNPSKSHALDYGAGTGRNSVYLTDLDMDVLAVDQNIKELEELAVKNSKLHPLQADLRCWKIPELFDMVVATNVLQFFNDNEATQCLINITNCLHQNGVLCLTYILDKKLKLPPDFEEILTTNFRVINSETKIVQDPGHPGFPEPHQHKIFYFLGLKE